MARARTKKFATGDLVRYTTKFRQSTGMVTGAIDGIVVGNSSLGPIIIWSHRDWPIAVNAANVEKKRTQRTRKDLLSAARLALGVPVGEPGVYRVYSAKKGRASLQNKFAAVAPAMKLAEHLYDRGDSVLVLDPDGDAILALTVYPESNPKRGTVASKKRSKRKSNTHDPQKSTRYFEAAVTAADRELLDAVGALERNKIAQSIRHLNKASYWAGQARVERGYASRVDSSVDKRLKELEDGMLRWGKNLEDWIGKNAA